MSRSPDSGSSAIIASPWSYRHNQFWGQTRLLGREELVRVTESVGAVAAIVVEGSVFRAVTLRHFLSFILYYKLNN